jgi:hypothetical protein
MIKINSSYKYLLFFFALIALIFFSEISNSQDARSPACAAVITTPNVESLCETQPTTQKIIFHKVAFCTAMPTIPTSTTAVGMTNCTTVFENTVGATVSIEKGVAKVPDGTFTDPPTGNYTYAYVELSPRITYKANLVFSTAKALGSEVPVGRLSNSTLPAYTNCQTNGTAYRYWDFLKGIDCQSDVVIAVETTNIINSLDNGVALYGGTLTEGTNIGTTHLYLIQSNGTLASGSTRGNDGNVSKLIFFLPMNAKITPDTTNYNLLYNNTRGMVVWLNNNGAESGTPPLTVNANNGFYNIGFSAAYFDMTFQIQ